MLVVVVAIVIRVVVKYNQPSAASEHRAVTSRIADEVRRQYADSCALPPELPPHFAIDTSCCGQVECEPDDGALELWKKAGLPVPQDDSYFSYSTEHTDDGAYKIMAQHDFSCGGPRHTYTVTLVPTQQGSSCSLDAQPGIVTNEFE